MHVSHTLEGMTIFICMVYTDINTDALVEKPHNSNSADFARFSILKDTRFALVIKGHAQECAKRWRTQANTLKEPERRY